MCSDNEKYNSLRTAYQELTNSYRAIDDFRAKLLAFLPLASGTGIFLLLSDKMEKMNFAKEHFWAIGIFGLVITLGLFFYELHGIKKCDHLINRGRQIECDLGIAGQFMERPDGVPFLRKLVLINEPFTARIIYPAVLAAWMFLTLNHARPLAAPFAAGIVFLIGFFFPILLNLKGDIAQSPIREDNVATMPSQAEQRFNEKEE